jgi:small-conductance mechanosensitive channel
MRGEFCETPGRYRNSRLFRGLALGLVVLSWLSPLRAQQPNTPSQQTAGDEAEPEIATDQTPSPGEVVIDGRHILTVYQAIGSISPKERAAKITDRLIAVAKDVNVPPESVGLTTQESWTEITAGGKLLMAVTETDAKLAGKPRKQLASEDAGNIRQALLNYRKEHNWRSFLWDILYAFLATIALVPFVWIVRKLRLQGRGRLEKWVEARTESVTKKTGWQVGVTYTVSVIMAMGAVIRWLLLIALFQIYVTVVLSFFPSTRSVSHAITGWVLGALSQLSKSALNYLPNLVVIAVVIVITAQVFRLIAIVFAEISRGNLSFSGFYPEWAAPTARLVRGLVLVLVVIIIFPYLPGSKSPAFQGISIFVGVLLSLGSSSAVANAIAGVILTYMRSFSVGDWVKIGDTLGEVVEKNALVTRVITMKQEIITIPNATVMNGSVMNFTREAKTTGVIFHTTVTIGYDAPWKTVHQLLIGAALDTKHVLHTPAPFVLQTALNDFFVSYELNAYTEVPREMQYIYSDLHQNIQDRFNEAGVEICSPHFSALRDGNTITIPEPYRPPGYNAPGFRVDGTQKQKQPTTSKER